MENSKKTRDQNRRHTHDRRNDDLGPPAGWRDRRRIVERRLPRVAEDLISLDEWVRQMVAFLRKRKAEREEIRRKEEAFLLYPPVVTLNE